MSFIAGYLVGLSEAGAGITEHRAYIDGLPAFEVYPVYGDWEIRLKLAQDFENTDRLTYGRASDGSLKKLSEFKYYSLYFCVYRGGELMYGYISRGAAPIYYYYYSDPDDWRLYRKQDYTVTGYETVVNFPARDRFAQITVRIRERERQQELAGGGWNTTETDRVYSVICEAFGVSAFGLPQGITAEEVTGGFMNACYMRWLQENGG